MQNIFKIRLLSVLLILTMVFTFVPPAAFAEEEDYASETLSIFQDSELSVASEDPVLSAEPVLDEISAHAEQEINAEGPVAKIGDQTYLSLQAAVDAALQGDVITLIADENLIASSSRNVTGTVIPAGKNAVIDLNGHTYGYTDDHSVTTLFHVNPIEIYGKLLITGDGLIKTDCGDAITVFSGADVTINITGAVTASEEAIVTKPDDGQAISVTVNSGTFSGRRPVFNDGATVIINNGIFTAVDAENSFSIYTFDGETVINGGYFKNLRDNAPEIYHHNDDEGMVKVCGGYFAEGSYGSAFTISEGMSQNNVVANGMALQSNPETGTMTDYPYVISEFPFIQIVNGDQLRTWGSLDQEFTGISEIAFDEAKRLGLLSGTKLICSYSEGYFNVYAFGMEREPEYFEQYEPDSLAELIDDSVFDSGVKFIYRDANPTGIKVFDVDGALKCETSSLYEAVNLADKNGDTVVLGRDVKEQNGCVLKECITIDLNGHTVDGSDIIEKRIISTEYGAIIKDDSRFGGGALINGSSGGILSSSGNLTLRNITIKNCVSDDFGGGVRCTEGKLTLDDCVITGNYSSAGGGGVYFIGDSWVKQLNDKEINICVSGRTIITGNTSGEDENPDNLYIEWKNHPGEVPSGTFSPNRVIVPVFVSSDLKGSDICYTICNVEGNEIEGELTSGYKKYNPNASYEDYFRYEGALYHQNWNADGSEIGLFSEYEVVITSEGAAGSAVALLKGGGLYPHGSTATVTAVYPYARDYRFTGWYNGDICVSGSPQYSFPVTGHIRLKAGFESISAHRLSVDPKYASKITVKGLNNIEENIYQEGSSCTTPVTISYHPCSDQGETFLYWADENGNRICGSIEYSFLLVKDMYFTPVVSSPQNTKGILNVRFHSDKGLISMSTVKIENGSVSESAVIPVAPSRLGKSFSGWLAGGEVYSSDGISQAICDYAVANQASGSVLDVTAQYNLSQTEYYVTVKYLTDISHPDETIQPDAVFGPYSLTKGRVFTADNLEADGYYFDCWTDESSTVLSYTEMCSVRPSGDITLYAVYSSSQPEREIKPVINVTDIYDFTENGVSKIRTTVSYVVPEDQGYTFTSAGILYSTDYRADMEPGGLAKQYVSALNTYNGNITITYRLKEGETFYKAAGYVTFKKDGNTETLISQVKSWPENKTR